MRTLRVANMRQSQGAADAPPNYDGTGHAFAKDSWKIALKEDFREFVFSRTTAHETKEALNVLAMPPCDFNFKNVVCLCNEFQLLKLPPSERVVDALRCRHWNGGNEKRGEK